MAELKDEVLEKVSGGCERFGTYSHKVLVYTPSELDKLAIDTEVRIYTTDMMCRVFDQGKGLVKGKDGNKYKATRPDGMTFTIETDSYILFGPLQ